MTSSPVNHASQAIKAARIICEEVSLLLIISIVKSLYCTSSAKTRLEKSEILDFTTVSFDLFNKACETKNVSFLLGFWSVKLIATQSITFVQ
jgi:hypothetical protein